MFYVHEVSHCVFFEGECVFIVSLTLGDQCGEFVPGLLGLFVLFFAAAFAFPHLSMVVWYPQTIDMDVTKLFLCGYA